MNNLTKATKESDVYKYKLSKEYYKGIRSGTVVPYFNYYDQTENIENNHHLMYSSIHQEYPKGSINTVCNLVDNDGEVVLKQDYDLISHVIDGYRYLFRKKKKFSFNIITNEIKELIDSKNIKWNIFVLIKIIKYYFYVESEMIIWKL